MKSWFMKACSFTLVLILLVNLLPAQVIARELQTEDAVQSEQVSDLLSDPAASPGDAAILMEITENRTEYSKEYKLTNGLHMKVVYPESVHYEEDGQWKDIDNTLHIVGSGESAAYTNAADSWQVLFPQVLSGDTDVSVTKDGYAVCFRMGGELRRSGGSGAVTFGLNSGNGGTRIHISDVQSTVGEAHEFDYSAEKEQAKYPETVRDKLRSRISYSDVYNNTDIIYDLGSHQLKESVVIAQYDADLLGYRYRLNTGTLVPTLKDDGSIDLSAPGSGEIILTMPAPYMVDGAGAVSYDVTVALEQDGDEYILTYQMPTQWLAEEGRVWPVILDPIVSEPGYYSNVQDITVMELRSTSYKAGSLQCGWRTYRGVIQSYVQFNTIPELSSADVVVDASVRLYKPSTSDSSAVVEVREVTSEWESSELTWDNKPGYSETVEDFAAVQDAGYYFWNITDVVRKWYDTGSNTGIIFKAPDAVEAAEKTNYVQFYSSDYSKYSPELGPTLFVVFRNSNGLESYWDYTSASAGRAGTGYVNNYTGNLTWVHSDIGFGGNRMPVSISHIYNANDCDSNDFGLGYGWRTNYHQSVGTWDSGDGDADIYTSSNSYYYWVDGDGTRHYFIYDEDSEAYRDEDGLELTLTVGSSSYTITDQYGNTSRFDSKGRLTAMVNNQSESSSVTITYTTSTGTKISAITDGAGRVYSFTYSDDMLTRISYKGSGSTEIAYVAFGYESSNLKTVTDQDGKTCTYTYTDHLLTRAADIDGYAIRYTYSGAEPYRVIGVTEYDGTAEGSSLAIEYAHNQTTFTDSKGNIQITQFNDWGNVVSVQDSQGRAQFAQYAVNDHDETGGKGNQLLLSSKMQNTVVNLLSNTSFESAANWTATSSAVSCSSWAYTDAFRGNQLLRLYRETAGTAEGAVSPAFPVTAGETYTFSAYIKTGEASAYLELTDGTNSAVSEVLAANSGWTRLEVSYTATASTRLVARVMTTDSGSVWMDCAQAEQAPTASRYNLIENGDFRYGESGWTRGAYFTSTEQCVDATAAAPQLDSTVYSITGSTGCAKHLYQRVYVSGEAGDTFVLSGWAKGDAAPLTEENRKFALVAYVNYTDGSKGTFTVKFNPDVDSAVNWQYAAGVIVTEKAYSSINIDLQYDYNVNTVYFDGIQLFKEEFGTSYTYNDDGEVVSVKDLQSQTTEYEYDTEGNLSAILQDNKAKMTYEYDEYHNVTKATSSTGVVYEFTYDKWGNNTSVSIVSGSTKITSTAEYSTDGNILLSTKDALDNETKYGYNVNTNVLEWVQYPEDTEDTRTEYSYDTMCRLASATVEVDSGYSLDAAYTYEDDLLTAIETNSTTYHFTYGDFSLISSISVGSRTLASYTYTDDHELKTLTYGNGDSVSYTYDDYGRVIAETFEDGDTVTYAYDNTGALATVTDSATGRKTTYYYDFTNRLMKYVESGENYSHSVGYDYDTLNNLTLLVETINGVEHTTSYTYDDDNRVTSVTVDGLTKTYTYDALGRVSTRVTSGSMPSMTESFTYDANRISIYETVAYNRAFKYLYTYDDNGNITAIEERVHNPLARNPDLYESNTTSYTYDSANQLIREDNPFNNTRYVWTYDDAGNITARSEYDLSTGELLDSVTYTYGNSEWGDLLTAYDGNAITYDTIGNPLTDGTWTYTWEHGRQLASMTDGETTWTYTYDANGMRTSRTDGTTTYTYVYSGSKLVQMTVNEDVLNFTYDVDGNPMSFTYNGTVYYYVTNLQGDVVMITNYQGIAIASYNYDAWGNVVFINGNSSDPIVTINPLRYRGYVYDTETGLYYLQSRYYNPVWGRFINADSTVSTGQGFAGNNMFAYCGNDPVNRYDDGGCSWKSIWEKGKSAVRSLLHSSNSVLVSIGVDTAAVGGYLLNMTKDSKGVYHANFNCWQQYFGYNDMYDFMFDVGTSMKSAKFAFSLSNGQEYALWAWKGDYINLGAGAELGIYYGGDPHWRVDKSLAMQMSLTLKYNGRTIISYSSTTWWITGFNPKYLNVKASSLTATFTVKFNNYGMFSAFWSKYRYTTGWSYNTSTWTATYTF